MFWEILWLHSSFLLANMLPIVFGRGGHPIDNGRCLPDKQPILGRSKTVEGTVGALFGSILITAFLSFFFSTHGRSDLLLLWGDDQFEQGLIMVTMAAGALLGDLGESFIKRRLKMPSGQKWLFFDQLDAVAGAWLLTYICNPDWFKKQLIPGNWQIVAIWIVIYLILHPLSSWAANRLGLKNQPH